MTQGMDLVYRFGLMELVMKEHEEMTLQMVRAGLFILMEILIQETGRMTWLTGRVSLSSLMGRPIKENGLKITNKASVPRFGQTAQNIKASIKMA